MTVKIDGSNGLLANYDYQTPLTGFSYTFTTFNVLFAVPAGTLATGTVTMSATPVDGTVVTITSTQQITALTINANTGQSIIGGGAVQLNANTSRQYMYRAANTTWYLTNIDAGNVVTSAVAGTNISVSSATGAVTFSSSSYPLTSGTAVASTSGTIINYTSIPSWVRRITVMFANVSTNGSSTVIVRLGSGSIQTTGYDSTASCGTAAGAYQSSTAGFLASYQGTNSNSQLKGALTFTLLGSNIWIQSGCVGDTVFSQTTSACSGSVTLGGVLDRLAITTLNGTDAFDAGSVNILYE